MNDPRLPRRVLLTGAAGFIGSHLAEALLARGARLEIVDDLNDFYDPAWKRANLEAVRRRGAFEFHQLDICDYPRLQEVVLRAKPDCVIHLAARAGVRPSVEQPRLYEQVNVGGTVNLLELCRVAGVQQFVFASSSSVYGLTSQAPFQESHLELRPISPYAATKLAGEQLCATYAHLFGMKIVALRFFTVYGPRQRPDLAIRKFTSLLESGRPLPVYGALNTGRDYTYIDDIIAGVLSATAFNAAQQDGGFEIFNLGNSRPVRLEELIVALERVTGREAELQRLPAQPGDVPLTWADLGKSREMLSYVPQTQLEDGLTKFLAWFRESQAQTKRAAAAQ